MVHERAIKVEQLERMTDNGPVMRYLVFEAFNTTRPVIGEVLTQEQVDELIEVIGIRVTVRGSRQ